MSGSHFWNAEDKEAISSYKLDKLPEFSKEFIDEKSAFTKVVKKNNSNVEFDQLSRTHFSKPDAKQEDSKKTKPTQNGPEFRAMMDRNIEELLKPATWECSCLEYKITFSQGRERLDYLRLETLPDGLFIEEPQRDTLSVSFLNSHTNVMIRTSYSIYDAVSNIKIVNSDIMILLYDKFVHFDVNAYFKELQKSVCNSLPLIKELVPVISGYVSIVDVHAAFFSRFSKSSYTDQIEKQIPRSLEEMFPKKKKKSSCSLM